jgi:hypothetical protein
VKLFEVITFVTVGDNGKINTSYLPAMNYIPTSQKAAAGGVASLDSSGKVPSGQLPSMDYIPTNQKGSANGVASLNGSGKVPSSQLPSLDYIPNNQKGTANGVASLNASGLVPTSQLPDIGVPFFSGTETCTNSNGDTLTVNWAKYGRIVQMHISAQLSNRSFSRQFSYTTEAIKPLVNKVGQMIDGEATSEGSNSMVESAYRVQVMAKYINIEAIRGVTSNEPATVDGSIVYISAS